MNIFLKYIISGIQKTFDYKGRAVRSEYWWFILFAFIYYFIFIIIFGGEAIENGAIFLLHNLVWLPAISLLVRRLHDVGRSGWWVLISLTGFGAFLLLYWAVKKSSPDKNQWGNSPESFKEDNKDVVLENDNVKDQAEDKTQIQPSELEQAKEASSENKPNESKPNKIKDKQEMSNAEKLYNEFPHISEEPKEFNFGSMVGYAMMMLSVSWDDDGDQDEFQVIFNKLQNMWGVPVRTSGDKANEIWIELQLWYNALTDLPNYGSDEKYKIVEWMIESVKNPTGKLEDDISDMILQETADPTKLGDKDWAPGYFLQALIDVANANNKVTGDEKSFLIWCAEKLGYDINFDNLTFSKSSEEKSEPEHSEEEAFGVLPKHWKDEHVISCLVRNMMFIDNNVSDEEMGWMNKTIEEYTAEGTDLFGVWDDVDDYLVQLFDEDRGKYSITVTDCEDYIAKHYNDDQKNKLITTLMNMASQDNVVEYSEFIMLASAMHKWFPGSLDQMVDALRNNGIKVITDSNLTSEEATQQQQEDEKWTIIHDLAVFYNYFANLADGTMKKEEMTIISDIMPKWKFIIDDVAYGLSCNNPANLEEVMNLAYDEMYGKDGSKDPMERVNQSQKNFVDYYNKGGILNGQIIGTFLNTLYQISDADGVITEAQDHQLRWYINQWKPACSSAEKVEELLDLKKTKQNTKESLVSDGVPEEVLDESDKDISSESSSSTTSTEPSAPPTIESSDNPIESFREYLLGYFPKLKLPKGKKYVEFPVYKGILVCCMVKTNGVNVYLYSGGRVPAREIFDKLNSLGVSGKVINDKYTITPMPGSRNPNIVRIDLLVPYDNRDLDNNELRKEVLDLYTQLIDLCMPLNPDNLLDSTSGTTPSKSVDTQPEKLEPVQEDSSDSKPDTPEKNSGSLKIVIEGDIHQYMLGELPEYMQLALSVAAQKYVDGADTGEQLLAQLWRGDPSQLLSGIPPTMMTTVTKALEPLLNKSWGSLWEEFNVFYKPFVFDKDNNISIHFNDEVLYEGAIAGLLKDQCLTEEIDTEEVFNMNVEALVKPIYYNKIKSSSHAWNDECISLDDKLSFFESFADGAGAISDYGWWFGHYTIKNNKWKEKFDSVDFDNRVSVIERGRFKVEFDEFDVEDFDWKKLIWLEAHGIEEFGPTGEEYQFSEIFYADEKAGIQKLDKTITDFDLKSTEAEFSWPTDE